MIHVQVPSTSNAAWRVPAACPMEQLVSADRSLPARPPACRLMPTIRTVRRTQPSVVASASEPQSGCTSALCPGGRSMGHHLSIHEYMSTITRRALPSPGEGSQTPDQARESPIRLGNSYPSVGMDSPYKIRSGIAAGDQGQLSKSYRCYPHRLEKVFLRHLGFPTD